MSHKNRAIQRRADVRIPKAQEAAEKLRSCLTLVSGRVLLIAASILAARKLSNPPQNISVKATLTGI
jgi:hypothetical protein